MPASGLPVRLRMLSAPAPRDVRPSSWIAVGTAPGWSAGISRSWGWARVVMWLWPAPKRRQRRSGRARAALLQGREKPFEILLLLFGERRTAIDHGAP